MYKKCLVGLESGVGVVYVNYVVSVVSVVGDIQCTQW